MRINWLLVSGLVLCIGSVTLIRNDRDMIIFVAGMVGGMFMCGAFLRESPEKEKLLNDKKYFQDQLERVEKELGRLEG